MDRTDPEHKFDYEVDFQVTKKKLPDIISRCLTKHGTKRCAIMLDHIKAQGYKYSTLSAITVAVPDAIIPEEKPEILAAADKKVEKVMKNFNRGLISDEERYKNTVEIWQAATEEVSNALSTNLKTNHQRNPIYMMSRLWCSWFYGPDQAAGRQCAACWLTPQVKPWKCLSVQTTAKA